MDNSAQYPVIDPDQEGPETLVNKLSKNLAYLFPLDHKGFCNAFCNSIFNNVYMSMITVNILWELFRGIPRSAENRQTFQMM